MEEIAHYLQKIKDSGMRITEQRKAVLNCLLKASTPLTAQEAYDAIHKRRRKKIADLASFYRIFEAFEELEIIHKVSGNSYVLCQHIGCSDKNHLLLNCRNCEGYVEMHMPDKEFDAFANFLKKNKKFQIDRHPLNLDGICVDCR